VVVVSAAVRAARCVVVSLVVGVLVLGCGDDEPSPGKGSPSTSATTEDATGGSSPSTGEATPSLEPAVAAAAGLLLEEETSQLNAPEGDWERIPDIVDYATAVGLNATTEVISLSDRENFATQLPLAGQVKAHNQTLPEGAVIERQPDVVLDGAPAYYVQWYEEGDTKIQHDIGIDHEGRVIEIQMDLSRSDPAATEALVEAVIASFRWR
jgi:hypothetical protein